MNTKNNNKNTDKILETIITPSGDNLLVKSRDNQNYLYLENSNFKLTPNKFLSLFIKDNKLILDEFPKIVKLLKLNEVSKAKYFIKEIKHLETGKTMDYIQFKKEFSKSNYAKNNNLNFKNISQDIILDYVKTNQNNWDVKLEDNNSDNSLFDNDKNDVIDMFSNDMENNQFEGNKNVSKRLFNNPMAIRFKAWYPNNKDTARKYDIHRNLNMKYNTENSNEIDKYIKCYENEIENKSVSNNNNLVSNNSVSLEL
tara:strand:+ start:240 stop:1004 length:765 start_codon:yes stop_codon:yes gene_type:complete